MAIGIPETLVDSFDMKLALSRISNDLQSDFIYAPHLSAVYLLAGKELGTNLKNKLKEGKFEPALPVTIEVPKASGFTRPGSILLPYERLAYQLVVDSMAITADKYIDRTNVFSNSLIQNDVEGFMFNPPSDCYDAYKKAIKNHISSGSFSFVLQADVVSHFQNLNQHNLINLLSASGCNIETVKFLEKFLSLLTEKDSRGIVQGIQPSDFLGNFSLCSIDGQLSVSGYNFARYVDDISIFFSSENQCKEAQVKLSQWLRKEGLNLNEAKTKILPVEIFLAEETKVEQMFDVAKEGLTESFSRGDLYNSTISWDFDPYDEPEVVVPAFDLTATRLLFSEEVDERTRDKIDKYCISIFIAAGDHFAVTNILKRYNEKPHLAQVYAKYLQKMISNNLVDVAIVEALFQQPLIFGYQWLWLYAALMIVRPGRIQQKTIAIALSQFTDANLSSSLRATCAIFISRFGSPVQKRVVKDFYAHEQSEYVKAAILYSARYFTAPERSTCYRAWGGHSELNSLIVTAALKTPDIQ